MTHVRFRVKSILLPNHLGNVIDNRKNVDMIQLKTLYPFQKKWNRYHEIIYTPIRPDKLLPGIRTDIHLSCFPETCQISSQSIAKCITPKKYYTSLGFHPHNFAIHVVQLVSIIILNFIIFTISMNNIRSITSNSHYFHIFHYFNNFHDFY